MRILYVFIFVILANISTSVFALQKTGIQYSVPIDYSYIDKAKLNAETEVLFQRYVNVQNNVEKVLLLDKLLSNYSILSEIETENPFYATRLGVVFDALNKDRLAKSNFAKSINLDRSYAYSYYSYGNFLYKRKKYRKALKQFFFAYENGYNTHYDTLYKIGAIYEKFGDYSNSIKYYNKALSVEYSGNLATKINTLKELLNNNDLYNDSLMQRNDK